MARYCRGKLDEYFKEEEPAFLADAALRRLKEILGDRHSSDCQKRRYIATGGSCYVWKRPGDVVLQLVPLLPSETSWALERWEDGQQVAGAPLANADGVLQVWEGDEEPSPLEAALAQLKEIVGDEWREPSRCADDGSGAYFHSRSGTAILFMAASGAWGLQCSGGALVPLDMPNSVRVVWRAAFGEPAESERSRLAQVRLKPDDQVDSMKMAASAAAKGLSQRHCPRCNAPGAQELFSSWDCPECGRWNHSDCVTDEVVRKWAVELRKIVVSRVSCELPQRHGCANSSEIALSLGGEFCFVAGLPTPFVADQYAHPTREGAIQLAWDAHADEIRRAYYGRRAKIRRKDIKRVKDDPGQVTAMRGTDVPKEGPSPQD